MKALKLYSFEENDAITALVDQAFHNHEFRQGLPLPFIRSMIGHFFNHVVELLDFTHVDQIEEQMNYLIDFMKAGLASDP